MKILLISDYDGASYGAERQMFGLHSHLREMGHDVRILTSNVMYQDAMSRADYHTFGTNHEKLQVISQTVNIMAYHKLRRILSEFQPDIVHVQMFLWQMSPLIMPLLSEYPAIYHPCVYKVVCPVGSKTLPDGSPCHHRAGRACLANRCVTAQTWSFMMLQIKMFRQWRHVFDRVVAVSHTVKEIMLENDVPCTDVIYNGVPECSGMAELNDTPLLVYAGRLDKNKGVDVLLCALSHVVSECPTVHLLIAGDGKQQGQLKSLVNQLDLQDHVTFLGYVEKEILDIKFQSAWVQVAPSIWAEPFGNIVPEAMMRGTVPIASNNGGMSELFHNDVEGILVPPNDPVSLSHAILRLIQSPDKVKQMRRRAYDYAHENYTEKQFALHMQKLYEEVIHEFHA